MSSDLSDAVPTGAAAACDAIGARMLTEHLGEGGAGSSSSDHRNALACPAGLALALAVLRVGAPDAAAPPSRGLVWSAAQRALRRFDASDPEQLRNFDPGAIPDKPLLHVANQVLVIGELQPRREYLDAVARWYDAEIGRAPLTEAKASLDAWAALHTGGLIRQSGIDVGPDTRLVVQNALLFAARWAAPFEAGDTVEGAPFTRADRSTSRADLMSRVGSFTLVTGPGWRALRLPYVDDPSAGSATLAMDIILPNKVVSPAGLPQSTWSEATRRLTAAQETGATASVRLRLPRLDLSSQPTDLTGVVGSLGARLDRPGGLDHIAPGLLVDQIVQQVRLIVAEEGTVAAALTEIACWMGAPADWEDDFIVDRPYVLRIVDQASGIALIEAAVLDPAASSRPRFPAPAEDASRSRTRLSRRGRGSNR